MIIKYWYTFNVQKRILIVIKLNRQLYTIVIFMLKIYMKINFGVIWLTLILMSIFHRMLLFLCLKLFYCSIRIKKIIIIYIGNNVNYNFF